jgi:uncharacterized protein YktB (UPF0637 family)
MCKKLLGEDNMETIGFTKEDFEVFLIDGFEERMEAVKTKVKPKLELLGGHFAPSLTALTGNEMHYHVAKHARRSVNPPKDTWVAFSENSRGYKMMPHFQIGLWETHLFIWYAVIYEAPQKEELAKKFEDNISFILKEIPNEFVWSSDHTKPIAMKQSLLGESGLLSLFERVRSVKKAEMLCGIQISKAEVIKMSSKQLIGTIEQTFNTLSSLYTLK